jgi:hypothetical protein
MPAPMAAQVRNLIMGCISPLWLIVPQRGGVGYVPRLAGAGEA